MVALRPGIRQFAWLEEGDTMPIQELLVSRDAQLARPHGVLFDPPCKTRDEDIQSWNDMVPAMAGELAKKRLIMVLVQTRNTRTWDATDKQYQFNAPEDYIVASYSCSPELGAPYIPGTVSGRWLVGKAKDNEGRTMGLDSDMIHMFQCSAQGCNLSTVGLLKLTKFHMTNGKTSVEAFNSAKTAISDGQKFGWRGGAFPKPNAWVSGTLDNRVIIGRGRSNAVYHR
jgi:hypothetical protein